MGRSAINLGIIIQARMGSKRLPGKILLPIGDKVLLDHILFRLSFLQYPARTVIATTHLTADDTVESFCRERGVPCFRGSETNVLERYYRCAERFGFDQIVRLTGDNPFVDVEELDRLIDLHFSSGSDFSHSFGSLPVGVGAEIFTFVALQRSFLEAMAPHHLEHVDEYMLENQDKFNTSFLQVKEAKHKPELRLTIDTEEDYQKACYIVKNAQEEYIPITKVIELCLHYV